MTGIVVGGVLLRLCYYYYSTACIIIFGVKLRGSREGQAARTGLPRPWGASSAVAQETNYVLYIR